MPNNEAHFFIHIDVGSLYFQQFKVFGMVAYLRQVVEEQPQEILAPLSLTVTESDPKMHQLTSQI